MKDKLLTILFILIIGSLSLANLITPSKVFSSRENRYLQQFTKPTLESTLSGKFATDFEKYAGDQFVMRDSWIGLKTLSEKARLKKDNGRIYFGKNGYLFDVDLPIEQNRYDLNIKSINTLISQIKDWQNDVTINTLLVPSKSNGVKNYLPLFAPVVDEKALLEKIKNDLSSGINNIDVFKELFKNENTYYKTDHHWTSFGAYLAYSHYVSSQGIKPLSLNDFIIKTVVTDFLGTSYRKANFYTMPADTIEKYTAKKDKLLNVTYNQTVRTNNLYEESFLDKTDKYSFFMGGDHALVEINSDVENGKTLVVLKDSFANSLIPFLTNHYKTIYVIDTRYYNGSIIEYIKDSEADEVLLLYNIKNLVSEKTLTKLAR